MQLIPCSVHMPDVSEDGCPPKTKLSDGYCLMANEDGYLGLGYPAKSSEGVVWKTKDGQTLPASAVVYWAHLAALRWVKGQATEVLDEDGYPTHYAHGMLASWPWTDPLGWMRLAQSLWHHGQYGFHLEMAEGGSWTADVSTLGWSGNEGLIAAMKKNTLLWSQVWVSTRRGGHYVFEHKEDQP